MPRPWGCFQLAPGFLLIWMSVFSCRFRGFILLLTFLIYTCYHMSRKPISVVKVRLVLGANAGPGDRRVWTSGHCPPPSLALLTTTLPSAGPLFPSSGSLGAPCKSDSSASGCE